MPPRTHRCPVLLQTHDPMTRARPRKDRRQCEADRRDGARCSAPAIPGGTVCRVHGGSAPQVRRAATRVWLMERVIAAVEAWQADPGVPGQLTATQLERLGRAAIAERDLAEYETKLTVIRLLRAELSLRAADRRDPHASTPDA